ncbi:MAG: hypothetical protein FWE83_01190 [Oscillospiraceae bacterium]|nr:hypothetical protein [Oscillospiraceae bacterium]
MKAKRIFAILLVVMFLMSAFPIMALAGAAPTVSGATVRANTSTITITFGGHGLDTAVVPNIAAFTVEVADPADLDPEVTAVAVTNATTVTLTLDEPIPTGATGVTVSYNPLTAVTPLICDGTDGTPVEVAIITNQAVTVTPANSEDHTGGGGMLLPTTSYEQHREATLPTSAGFTFVLDPQGLYNLTDTQILDLVVEPIPGGTRLGRMYPNPTGTIITECNEPLCPDHGVCAEADCEDHVTGGSTPCPLVEDCNEVREGVWGLLEDAGQIIFSDYAPFFINNSNFDVALEIEFAFGAAATGVVAVATPDAVTGPAITAPNVFIGAKFSSANIITAPGLTDFTVTGDIVLPIQTTARTPLFLLGAAQYTDVIEIDRDVDDVLIGIDVEQRKTKAIGDNGHGTRFTLYGDCNPDADWSGVDASDLAIDIKLTLTTPPTTPDHVWEFPTGPLASPGTPIAGAYGLVAGNGLTAASFIDTSAVVPVGFIIGGAVSGDPDDATMTDDVGVVLVPFHFGDSVLAGVSLYSMGSHNDMGPFIEEVSGGIEIDFTGWPEDDYEITVWLDLGTPFIIVITLTD